MIVTDTRRRDAPETLLCSAGGEASERPYIEYVLDIERSYGKNVTTMLQRIQKVLVLNSFRAFRANVFGSGVSISDWHLTFV